MSEIPWDGVEYAARCLLCPWSQGWTTERAAQAASVWHVYLDHLGAWEALMGPGVPRDDPPESYGRQFENWERQT